jgi:hypothetical protein
MPLKNSISGWGKTGIAVYGNAGKMIIIITI